MYTIATAAAAVGRNKIAILRAIKSGKVSAAKDENGEWQIDPPNCTVFIHHCGADPCGPMICIRNCISRRC